jgi:quercetin dioxygenase-like cupin family protein
VERPSPSNPVALHQLWNWTNIPVEKLEPGIERQMIYGDRLMVCRLRFAPHTVTPAHDHPHEQITIVERGRARFVVGDEERLVAAGDVLLFPGGFWHGATILDEETVFIDIFSPIRQEFLAPREAAPAP